MNLDIPVFDLQNLRKYFYYFFAINLLIVLGGYMFGGALNFLIKDGIITSNTTWIILLALFIPTFIYTYWSKKELARIISTPGIQEQFNKYERFFKKRLAWNMLSLVITAAFLLMNNKRSFFYLLVMQMVLSLLLYPNKKVITRELKNEDIVFT